MGMDSDRSVFGYGAVRAYFDDSTRVALTGRTAALDRSEPAAKLAAITFESGTPRTFAGCVTDVYPRYVGHGWPAGKYY